MIKLNKWFVTLHEIMIPLQSIYPSNQQCLLDEMRIVVCTMKSPVTRDLVKIEGIRR